MIKALRSVAHQAIEDSKTKREMTEEQAKEALRRFNEGKAQ